MTIHTATDDDFDLVCKIVHDTIETVYSSFYPENVVSFFLDHHSAEQIREDIREERVYLLDMDGVPVGTGTIQDNEIKRVFVLPAYQRKGYGSLIMRDLESVVARTSTTVRLDSSLPGYGLYLKLGYRQIAYRMISTPGGQVLCYHEMEKTLGPGDASRDETGSKAVPFPQYDNHVFRPAPDSVSAEGGVSAATTFVYHQEGPLVWAEYSGGEILKGFLVGTCDERGELEFVYEQINRALAVRTGSCRSAPEVLADGRIRLHEKWKWSDSGETGESVLEEVR